MEENMNAAIGIKDILIDAINKKYDSVRDLDSIKVNLTEEEFDPMIPVIDSIIEDENNHIGKLQQLVDLLSGDGSDIEEGKQDTLDMIDNSNEFMESVTSMKKKLILSENFDNVIDDVQAVADPVFVGANEEHDENKKKYEDAIEENKKEAEETIPKEGETGEKVKSKALKQMHLSEELFDEKYLSNGFIKWAGDSIKRWILEEFVDLSNDEIVQVLRYVINEFNNFSESLKEDLSFEDYSDFNSDVYNAVSEVCFKYGDKLSKKDIESALEWFESHFFEDDDWEEPEEIDHMTGVSKDYEIEESLNESLEDEVDRVIAILDNVKETGKQNDSWIDLLYDLFDKYGREKVKLVFSERRANHLTESIQYSIAKEQIKRFTEGKMPNNWNVDTYLTKLTEKKHISDNEAKSLKEWYSTIK